MSKELFLLHQGNSTLSREGTVIAVGFIDLKFNTGTCSMSAYSYKGGGSASPRVLVNCS